MTPPAPSAETSVWSGNPGGYSGLQLVGALSDTHVLLRKYGIDSAAPTENTLYLFNVTTDTPALVDTFDHHAAGYYDLQWTTTTGDGQGSDVGGLLVASCARAGVGTGARERLCLSTNTGDTLNTTFINPGFGSVTLDPRTLGDGTGFVVEYSLTEAPYHVHFAGYDVAGTSLWTWDPGAAASPAYLHGSYPRTNRLVFGNTSGDTIDLRDETGALLDSIAWGYDAGAVYQVLNCGPDRVAFTWADGSTTDAHYRLLDTTGDVLTWVTTAEHVTTDWTGTGVSTHEWASWDGQLVAGNRYSPDSDKSLYWVNPATGSTASTPATSDVSGLALLGWYATFVQQHSGVFTLLRGVPTALRFLRQRQTGRGNPIRVRQTPSLRQRQTHR